ncbi:MAG: 16S rRNA (guanine(966)-N(2))-methyltransferase RsmD [Clostridia bacterium]|nr:16S rRNA (guanine(966)-N(2))-methyltransferase RsmD [Clostridia bacterium]
MRVISGTARGRKLISPEGMETRPTSDRVKESVFNIISPDIRGAHVLDLFAGSGALGIEALSRGAETAVFVENSFTAQKVLKKNIELTHFEDRCEVFEVGFEKFLNSASEKFDIVFLDPPYKSGYYEKALGLLLALELLSDDGIVVAEYEYGQSLPIVSGFVVLKDRKYGKTSVAVLKKE